MEIIESSSDDLRYQVEIVSVDYSNINKLCIYFEGNLLEEHYDNTEAEDNTFIRDYDWVLPALINAYNFGYEEGLKVKKG